MSKPPDPTKSEAPLLSNERQINPAVKSWLTNVLIPAMFERYIGENNLGVESIETSHEAQQKPDAERSNA